MKITIHPSVITGNLRAPASKSSMQRACAAALLAKGTTVIRNPGHSNDDLAALDVISKLGARIQSRTEDSITVLSEGVKPVSPSINCGESGLGIRMFAPLAALSGTALTIEGTGSLLKRPMHFFDEIFPRLGVQIRSNNGHLPIVIQGPLVPADIEIDGSLSSQFLTGLLMAYAAAGADGVEIRVKDLKSRPYIDLTLEVMRQFRVNVENRGYKSFHFKSDPSNHFESSHHTSGENGQPAGQAGFQPAAYVVEGDWSGAAFLLVAGAIAGGISVSGLDPRSPQADKKVLEALEAAGAVLRIGEDCIDCAPADLKSFDFDATDCPDLFPPLVALAAYSRGTTTIKGVSRLTHKESNRGLTLQDEFAKMGIEVVLDGNEMRVHGGVPLNGADLHSRHDHRIAMAGAVAALKASGPTTIEEAQAIEKSYPDFYRDIQSLGALINPKILQS